jgi:hypothetical protein
MQESRESFYLSAPKVTDLLALMLVDTPVDLQLQYLQGALTPAFRAAALSASFIIVNYASKELLDTDPEEIEILEPRVQILKTVFLHRYYKWPIVWLMVLDYASDYSRSGALALRLFLK